MYSYGLIGNCQASALIGKSGSIDWLCMPRPDSPPVFGRLLDPDGGHFSVESEGGFDRIEQSYVYNTNVLVTEVDCKDGSAFRITDFCPRFEQHGRMYRPNSVFRIVEPTRGAPRVRVSIRPVDGWEKAAIQAVRGNSHLRFETGIDFFRVATNMPLTYLEAENPFALDQTIYFGLTWGVGLEEDLAQVAQSFLQQTVDYWKLWVKHCSIPTLYQKETIRSALTLKLHCYEDTGAILAALTTSLPEEAGRTRNWDYRFCWLRDAYYVLSAFRSLGHFEEMEGFLKFVLNIAHNQEHSREGLRPVYRLDQSLPLPELEHQKWKGFLSSAPVRSGNQAAEHVQNDVYGEMILTLAPIFMDERFHHLRSREHEALLEHLGALCARSIGQADAGLWEIRNGWQVHSFSSLMNWAGLDRVVRIRERGYLSGTPHDFGAMKEKASSELEKAVVEGVLRNGPTDSTLDAALLQLPILRYPNESLNRQTVSAIHQGLRLGEGPRESSFLYRYKRPDDFGNPNSAFLICSFWMVQALAKVGELSHAREVMNEVVSATNHLGLFSEHFKADEKFQYGNFPQAYSHVGEINAAFAVSPSWDQFL